MTVKKTILLGSSALLLAACTTAVAPTAPAPPTATGAPAPSVPPGAAGQRAVELAAAWPGSAAELAWRSGQAAYESPVRPGREDLGPQSVSPGSVSADGLTVTGVLAHGACDRVRGTEAYETDRVVVLIGQVVHTAGVCRANLVFDHVTVELSRPLGDRAVLDLRTGQPQLPGKR
jgi:hypothetical protein